MNIHLFRDTYLAEKSLSNKDLAEILGVAPSRITEWIKGKREVPTYIQAHIETLHREKVLIEELERLKCT